MMMNLDELIENLLSEHHAELLSEIPNEYISGT